jgi:GLPGLI family protein
MKNHLLLLTCVLFINNLLYGQHVHFTTSGTIEYEKKVNMHAVIKKLINKNNEAFYVPAFEAFKKNNPQFRTLKSSLTFGGNKTLYTPGEDMETLNSAYFQDLPAAQQLNTIYTDLNARVSVASKKVFDELFLVKDVPRKISWKITDETREIAGYTCRRANAIILDSVYVVAFYTDDIPVSGGPESFTGLPGMILGIALPHENVTWFATKVTETPIADNQLKQPSKGKPTTYNGLILKMQVATKSWGALTQYYLKTFLL